MEINGERKNAAYSNTTSYASNETYFHNASPTANIDVVDPEHFHAAAQIELTSSCTSGPHFFDAHLPSLDAVFSDVWSVDST